MRVCAVLAMLRGVNPRWNGYGSRCRPGPRDERLDRFPGVLPGGADALADPAPDPRRPGRGRRPAGAGQHPGPGRRRGDAGDPAARAGGAAARADPARDRLLRRRSGGGGQTGGDGGAPGRRPRRGDAGQRPSAPRRRPERHRGRTAAGHRAPAGPRDLGAARRGQARPRARGAGAPVPGAGGGEGVRGAGLGGGAAGPAHRPADRARSGGAEEDLRPFPAARGRRR